MIVADANIIVYATLTGDMTPLARRLRGLDPVWVVPSLCRHELANALLSHVKYGNLSGDDIPTVWDSFSLVIDGNEHDMHLPSVVRLAAERDISAYDAQYVALARQIGKYLVTEDKRLISRCPDEAQSLSQYLESQS